MLVWPVGSDTIRRYGLIGGGVASLEEVCGGGLEVSHAQAMPSEIHSLLSVACGSRCRALSSFSDTMSASTLPAHDNIGLNL